MISIKRTGWKTASYVGLSTDEKPSADNGDKFVELNTGKVYCYNKAGEAWVEMSSGGGGGSVTVDTALDDTSSNPVENKAIAKAVKAVNVVEIASSSWTLSDGLYTVTKSVVGMTSTSYPSATITYPSGITKADKEDIDEAANLLVKMETGSGTVTFYAIDQPQENLIITLKGM